VFTNSYPVHHRGFTSRRSARNSFPQPVDVRSLRSYEGGPPAASRAANAPAAGQRRASERGAPRDDTRSPLLYGNLEIRPDEIQALADGRRVGLTVREFQVLLVLAQREDRVVRRADIYGEVWGGDMKHRDRSVDVFVRKVRNKLAQAAPTWTYIHTHFGVGYRFAAVTAIIEAPPEPIASPGPISPPEPAALAAAVAGTPEPAQA
jgi:DNA-binding winged helix-turn-helix (wHTH) protein